MQIIKKDGEKRPAAPNRVQDVSSPAKNSGKPVKANPNQKGAKKEKENYKPPEIEAVTFH